LFVPSFTKGNLLNVKNIEIMEKYKQKIQDQILSTSVDLQKSGGGAISLSEDHNESMEYEDYNENLCLQSVAT
jgi:hypothetical protein